MIGRRSFISTVALGLLAAPLAACARQQGKVARIGWLDLNPIDFAARPGLVRRREAFEKSLRELGWVENENLVTVRRHADGRVERFPEVAEELVRLRVDVILTSSGDPAIHAAKRATSTIPIVMVLSSDPVGTGLIASLARPGGNVTGLSLLAAELGGKRLALLKEAIPRISRVAVLWNAAHPGKRLEFTDTQAAARALGVTLHSVEVRGQADFDRAFASIATARVDALVTFSEPLTSTHQRRIVDFAARNRLPMVSEVQEFAESGALMTYGPNFPDMHHRAAHYVDQILRGAKPADLPVEQPTKFELAINLRTAKALGLTISQSLLARADHVIQ